MGAHQIALQEASNKLKMNRALAESITSLQHGLSVGSSVVIRAEGISAFIGDSELCLSKSPCELAADVEAFLRLERLRKT